MLTRVNYLLTTQNKQVEKYGRVHQIANPSFTLTRRLYFSESYKSMLYQPMQMTPARYTPSSPASSTSSNGGSSTPLAALSADRIPSALERTSPLHQQRASPHTPMSASHLDQMQIDLAVQLQLTQQVGRPSS
jgi:hypothetical protein